MLQPFTSESTYQVSMPAMEQSSDLASQQLLHNVTQAELANLTPYAPLTNMDIITTNLPTHSNWLTNASWFADINWITFIWLTGTILSLSFFMFSHWKSMKKLQCAIPHQNDFLTQWQTTLNLKRPLNILISDQITTPLTLGLLKPKIILPADMNLQNQDNLQYILSHELHHIKRWDTLWKFLALFILCLHWFNPLVWIAFILANRDLEISCDAWVLKKFDAKTKKAYAQALLALAEHQNEFIPLHSSFARYAVEERIMSVMKTKKTTALGFVSALAIISLLTFNAFATAPLDEGEASQPVVDKIDEEFEGSISVLENLREITVGQATVRAGNLFNFHDALTDEDALAAEALTLSEAVVIMIQAIYDQYQFNADGLILDAFLTHDFHNENVLEWIGILTSADYDPTVRMPGTGYVPTNEQVLFIIHICGRTGEISRIVTDSVG